MRKDGSLEKLRRKLLLQGLPRADTSTEPSGNSPNIATIWKHRRGPKVCPKTRPGLLPSNLSVIRRRLPKPSSKPTSVVTGGDGIQ